MKRFICLLLIGALFSGMTANAQLADDYIFSESFCDGITNSADGGSVIATADEVRIINSREGDKALRLEASLRHSMSASAEFSGADDTFVVSFDIKGEGFIDEGKLNLYDGGGSAWKLLGFSGKDSVQLPDGKKIPGANISADTHFDVLVEQKASAVSVYVNGKCVVYRWYVNQMPKGIGKAELAFSAGKQGNANVIVDGIWVYNANIPRPTKSLPNEKYNPEEAEYTPTDFNSAAVGDSVYITRTFDETNTDFFTGFVSEPGPNTVEKAEERNGNAYVRIVKNYTTSGIFDVRNAYSERYVVEADLSMGDELLYGTLYVRGSPDSLYLLRFSPDGTVTLDGGEKVCKLSKGKWEHLAIVVDMSTSLLDIYLNGELLYNDYELPVYIPPSSIIRFYIGAGATGVGGELRIDNLKIYDGTEPMKEAQEEDKEMNTKDIAMNDANTLLSSEAVEKELLKDAVAVASNGAYLAKNGEKIKLDAPAYEDGESFMLPLRAMAAAFGFETGYNADTKEVTVADISIKDGAIYSGGAKVEVKANPVIKNGTTYIGAEEFAKYVAKKTLNVYSHGVAVLSDKGTAFNAEEEKKVNAYLFYERPDAGKILADFENKKNVHPRVVFDQEHIDRLKRLRDNNDKTAAWIIDAVISSADRYAKMKPAVWDDYKGVRASDHILGAARGVRDRLCYIAFAYLLTGNKDYIEPAWKQMQVAAEYEEWGEITTFLAVGETLSAYAVAYDWMYDAWTDEQRAFIEETMMKKGLEYSYMAYRGTLPPGNSSNRNWYWWENNWNQVCNGGTVMAAAALLDKYPAECAQIISDAIRSNENSIEAFYPLGAYAEGMGYQSYALRYLTPMYQTLKYTLGTDYNMLKGKGLSNVFNFSNDLSGPTTMPNNYHDASEATPSGGSAYLWCFADLYRDKNYFDERMFQMETIVDTPSIYDAMFYNPETDFTSTSQEERSPDAYYKGEELVSLRGAWQDTYTPWVSFHGGENNLGMHGHIDTGAFILEMLGERWSLDLGSNTYTNDYWGDRRYTYYKIRAEGHNTLVLNPDYTGGQVTGPESFAPVTRFESKDKGAISVLDMTNTYSENANSAKRGFMLCDDRRNVLIRDELQLMGDTDVYWFMHTDADIEIKDANTVILTKNGRKLKCVMTSNLADATFKVLDAKPMPNSATNSANDKINEKIKRLTINGQGKGYGFIQVKFMDVAAPEANDPIPTLGINEWTIPDGELIKLPVAESISLNSKAIDDFDSDNNNYTVFVPANADITQYKAEVTAAEGVSYETQYSDSGVSIKVYYPDMPKLATYYNINYLYLPNRADIEDYMQVSLSGVSASDYQEGNGPFLAVDGDTTTRWAANGNHWIIIELLDETALDAVGMYMMSSKSRTSEVKVELSTDNENWEKIFEGTIGGVKDGYDIVDAGGKRAKYVKLTANGNSVNTWNSVLEFTALKKR